MRGAGREGAPGGAGRRGPPPTEKVPLIAPEPATRTSRPGTNPLHSRTDESRTPHLILVGLPGAGKTTVGEALARELGRPFLDFDREIERREGMRVTAIFAERGERYFRERERLLTEELRSRDGMILSPGGGWVTNPGVVALLRPPARIIYLRIRPEVALERLRPELGTRPLLRQPDPLAALENLLRDREPLYAMADHVIDAELVVAQELARTIAELASASGQG